MSPDWGIEGLTEQERTDFLDALAESHPGAEATEPVAELNKNTIRDDLLRGLMTDHGCILHNGPNPEGKACSTCARRVDKVILPIVWSALETVETERARLKRALAGHLFDGESLDTREAIRSELIEQGFRQAEAVETLIDQWDDMLRTESEVMTTAQRNAWSFAVTELRATLAKGMRP